MFKNVRIYVVPPKNRGWYAPEPESSIFNDWFQKTRSIPGMSPQEIYLPGARLKKPTLKETQVLIELFEHGGSSRSLTTIIRWCGENCRDTVTRNRYSRLVRRLEKKGFVEDEPSFGSKKIVLTHFGKTFTNAVKICESNQKDNAQDN